MVKTVITITKRYFRIMVACLFLCFASGCENEDKKTQPQPNNIEPTTISANLDYLNQVSYIRLCDSVDGRYVESIDQTLDEEDLDGLKAIAGDITCSERIGNISTEYYALKFFDANDHEVATWIVGTRYTIEDSTGQVLQREKALKPWIEGIEKKYGITYSVLERTPGSHYFSKLGQSAAVDVQEIVEHPMIDNSGRSFSLSENEVQEMRDCEGKITLKEGEEDSYEYCMKIIIYSNAGGDLYRFWVTADGRVFVRTNMAYEVCGDEFIAWVRQIEHTYDLR